MKNITCWVELWIKNSITAPVVIEVKRMKRGLWKRTIMNFPPCYYWQIRPNNCHQKQSNGSDKTPHSVYSGCRDVSKAGYKLKRKNKARCSPVWFWRGESQWKHFPLAIILRDVSLGNLKTRFSSLPVLWAYLFLDTTKLRWFYKLGNGIHAEQCSGKETSIQGQNSWTTSWFFSELSN